MSKNQDVIKKCLNELDGLAFKGQKKYTKEAKVFFEDRYTKVINLLPEVSQNFIGLEIGLCSGVLAFSIKKSLGLEKLYSLEHPGTFKQYKKDFLKKVKEENVICEAVDLRMGKLPWKSSFFDFIVFSEVMEHLVPSDIPQILREFKRILKKSGFLLITTPNIASLIKRVNLLRGKNPIEFDLNIHDGGTFGHIREYSMQELLEIFQREGFNIKRKGYFEIDSNKNIYSRVEDLIIKIIPSVSNNLFLLISKI